jgi:transketolase
MRSEFAAGVVRLAQQDQRLIFLTGDLGYNALESVRDTMGSRFINTGVAEQNMVGMAAGMAYRGYKVICYSIAPFVVYRCLEQFRNDACLHDRAVFLVGNGGGYGYGIMGSTHHAIEDIGVLSGLQNMTTYVPAFADEVDPLLDTMVARARPAYLRLGAGGKLPTDSQTTGSLRQVVACPDPAINVVVLGPVISNILTALDDPKLEGRVAVYTAMTLPLTLPPDTAARFGHKPLVVAEEHVSTGGLAQQLSVLYLRSSLVAVPPDTPTACTVIKSTISNSRDLTRFLSDRHYRTCCNDTTHDTPTRSGYQIRQSLRALLYTRAHWSRSLGLASGSRKRT